MGELIDRRGLCCATCAYFYQRKYSDGHVCSNPDSRFVGAWVSEYHKCEDWRYDEDRKEL